MLVLFFEGDGFSETVIECSVNGKDEQDAQGEISENGEFEVSGIEHHNQAWKGRQDNEGTEEKEDIGQGALKFKAAFALGAGVS